MTAILTQLLYSFIALGALLLLGTFLRAKIPLLQRLFLPASVIGGTIGLLLGPNIMPQSLCVIPAEWVEIWAALPALLTAIIVSALPLSMLSKEKTNAGTAAASSIKYFLIILVTFFVQIMIGMVGSLLFSESYGVYDTFGYELMAGYNGGHNTAGVLGGYLLELGLPYWNDAQGVATTTATFGLVGGIVIGIIYLNVMVRLGKSSVLTDPSNIPEFMRRGIYPKNDQPNSGAETTHNATIESHTFHLSILLLCGGAAYAIMNASKKYSIPIIKDFPAAAICIFVMFLFAALLKRLKLTYLIDTKTVSHISGTCADFAITAALASMPIRVVLKYALPILFICLLGYILTFVCLAVLCRKCFNAHRLESFMAMWGSCTGTYTTGITLLKIADPEYSTPVMCDYSLGFSLSAPVSYMLIPVTIQIMLHLSHGTGLLIMAAGTVITLIALGVFCRRAPHS